MKYWEFPGGYGLTPTGSNGAGIETFLDNIPMSLTREVLQNSIDAHQKDLDKSVRVEFKFETIQAKEILGEDELANKKIDLKRMSDGDIFEASLENTEEIVKIISAK